MEKVLVLNTSKHEFTNDKTGELVSYCVTTIGHQATEDSNFIGYLLEEITGKVENYNIIKKYVGKICNVELLYKKVDKKNYRAKFSSIENDTLSE